ncbi:MAG: hypothetical protein AB1330_01385 [Bacillota bacterium]
MLDAIRKVWEGLKEMAAAAWEWIRKKTTQVTPFQKWEIATVVCMAAGGYAGYYVAMHTPVLVAVWAFVLQFMVAGALAGLAFSMAAFLPAQLKAVKKVVTL